MLSAIKQFYLLQCAHKCTQLANFSLLVFCHILNARFTCFSRMRNIFRVRIWVGIFNSNHYMQCMQQLCQSKLCEGEWNIYFFFLHVCMLQHVWPVCVFDLSIRRCKWHQIYIFRILMLIFDKHWHDYQNQMIILLAMCT